jgi:Transposase DNA-binding
MQGYRVDAWAETEFGQADLGDARRTARLVQLASVLGAQPTASLPDATDDLATLKAAYRFFDNDAVEPAQILASHLQATTARLRQVPLVLAVQDTTYLDWSAHPATTGLGPLVTAHQQGLLAHTTLAITPERVPLGLLAQEVWARDAATFAQQRDHKQRPSAEKESQKWLTSLAAVVAVHADCPTTHFVSVGDAEGDVYDLFTVPRPAGVDLLIRAAQNRRVEHPDKYLWAALLAAPVVATLRLHLPRRGEQSAREATVRVRWQEITLRPPRRRAAEQLPAVVLWAVWAGEEAPPDGVEAVEWLLLTTVPIQTTADALERLDWYACRWGIEMSQAHCPYTPRDVHGHSAWLALLPLIYSSMPRCARKCYTTPRRSTLMSPLLARVPGRDVTAVCCLICILDP